MILDKTECPDCEGYMLHDPDCAKAAELAVTQKHLAEAMNLLELVRNLFPPIVNKAVKNLRANVAQHSNKKGGE